MAAVAPMATHAAGFTQDQADLGRSLYAAQCSQCHGTDLAGAGATPLNAETMQNFGTAGGLFDMVTTAMPPQAPGELAEEQYLAIMAYILLYNGARPGDEMLTANYDELDSIDLVAATSVGDGGDAVAEVDEGNSEAVPQAYTWGKPLPGSDLFADASDSGPAESGVPQAYTWGKELPKVTQ